MLKVESVLAEHSPACMVAHGNRPVDKEPKQAAPAPRSGAARKTGSTTAARRLRDDDTDDDQAVPSQLSARHQIPDGGLDLFQDDQYPEEQQAESSQAAQRRAEARANLATSVASGSQSTKKRASEQQSSTSRSKPKSAKHVKTPAKPRVERIYNSVSHFVNESKAYSKHKSPFAELRRIDALVPDKTYGSKSKRKQRTTVLKCSTDDCPFEIKGVTLQDAAGRELEGFQIKEVNGVAWHKYLYESLRDPI